MQSQKHPLIDGLFCDYGQGTPSCSDFETVIKLCHRLDLRSLLECSLKRIESSRRSKGTNKAHFRKRHSQASSWCSLVCFASSSLAIEICRTLSVICKFALNGARTCIITGRRCSAYSLSAIISFCSLAVVTCSSVKTHLFVVGHLS